MVRSKLSQKERNELVTKGYLEDILERKQYATKEYVHDAFEQMKKEMQQHVTALMEDNRHQIKLLFEAFEYKFEARFQRIEKTLIKRI